MGFTGFQEPGSVNEWQIPARCILSANGDFFSVVNHLVESE